MGCSSSVKVKPVKGEQAHTKDALNGEHDNIVRGDRLSIADARQKREEESHDRLKRLSSQAIEESDKVRRNSSRVSADPIVQVLPEEEPIFKNTSSKDDENVDDAETERNETTIIQKIENNELQDNESDSDVEILKIVETHELKVSPRPLTYTRDEESTSEDENLEHAQRSSGDGKTDSPLADPFDMRKSVDSVKLRTNANLLVNDIMSLALHQIDNENKQQNTPGSVNTSSQEYMDARAKEVVDNILGNAMLVVKNETNSS